MKKLTLLFISLLLTLSISTSHGEFFTDIILTSPNGIWTDARAYSTLNSAITAAGSNQRTILITSPQTVTSLTIPSNITLKFERDGAINNSGQLTIQTKNIEAPNRQIFTGSGNIDFASGTILKSGWFANFESAIALTVNDTITLQVTKSQTLTASFALGDNVSLEWNAPGNILTINNGVTLSNIKHITAGDYQILAGAGDFDFIDGIKLNLKWFAHLRSAITFIESVKAALVISGSNTVDYSDTVPSNIYLDFASRQGSLIISDGITLTFASNNISDEDRQIFAFVGTGAVAGLTYAKATWFGSTKTSTTLNIALSMLGIVNKSKLIIPSGDWTKVGTDTITFTSNINLEMLGTFKSSGDGAFDAGDITGLSEPRPQYWGAKGDNSTDDTTAIQCALTAMDGSKTTLTSSGATTAATVPRLYFPPGIYLISTDLTVGHYGIIEGDRAIIKAHADYSGTYALTGNTGGWELVIKGLSFDGFTNDIYLNNNNADQGKVSIEKCKFYGSDKAIHLKTQSTSVTIADCKFDTTKVAIYNELCNKLIVKDSWIKQDDLADNEATIVNYDTMTLSNNIFVPATATGTDTAWINNHHMLTAVHNRFGGETGSKCIVNNYAVADSSYPVVPVGIYLEDNEIYAVDGDRVAIRLFAVPNYIVARNNNGFTDDYLMGWGTGTTPATLISDAGGARFINIDVSGNIGYYAYNSVNFPANHIPSEFFINNIPFLKVNHVAADSTNAEIGDRGWTYTNDTHTSANATVVLPAAIPGLEYTFFRNNSSRVLRADPDGSETIGTGGAGKYLQIDTDKVGITLKCFVAGHWEIVGQSGEAWGSGYTFES